MRFGAVVGAHLAAAAGRAGFDFIEVPIARTLIPAAVDSEYEATRQTLVAAGTPVEAGCVFFPPDLKVIGPDVSFTGVTRYSRTAFTRAAGLGMKVAVFGSGKSRAIPEGFPRDQAERQLRELLTMMGDTAAPLGLTIAIEPLNRQECNWINSIGEARAIVDKIAHPAVKILADIFHISAEKEGFHGVLDAGTDVVHVHVSSVDRSPPRPDGADWVGLFRALKALGYESRLSMECRWEDFPAQAPEALEFLQSAWHAAF